MLVKGLREYWKRRQREIQSKFNRTLPFGDYVVDRWEKAATLGFGKGSSVYDSVVIIGDVSVQENTWIGPAVILDGSGGLAIGANCSISAGVQIYSHDSVLWAISGGTEEYQYAATRVGDNCYIGPNTVIAKGVTIGNQCIVGANSLVLQDLSNRTKSYGSPCKVVGPISVEEDFGC
jgi:acetyltransferase-like isoleucine patch superfamily enzyme